MIQVQRFNKVLKLAVILGDLVILNVLFISFNSIWNELFGERACSGTLPPNSNSVQRMLFCMHYFRRCHTASSGEPVPTKLYSGYSATCSISLFFIDRTDGIIRT